MGDTNGIGLGRDIIMLGPWEAVVENRVESGSLGRSLKGPGCSVAGRRAASLKTAQGATTVLLYYCPGCMGGAIAIAKPLSLGTVARAGSTRNPGTFDWLYTGLLDFLYLATNWGEL